MKRGGYILLIWFALVAHGQETEPRAPEATERGIQGLGRKGGADTVELGTYRALLIGIADYPDHPALKTPVKDIDALEKVLKEKYGFSDIRRLVNEQATRKNILKTLRQLGGDTLGERDNLLIYFAGHGDLHGERAYWIPYDGDEDEETWVSAIRIRELINDIRARHILLIADSCFSGALNRNVVRRGDDIDRYLREVIAAQSREMVTSGGEEPVSDWGPESLSLFAYFLVSMLEDNQRNYITVPEIFDTVVRNVTNRGRQKPEYGRITGTVDHRGHFVFAKVGAARSVRATDDKPVGDGTTRGSELLGYSLPGNVKRKAKGLYTSLGPDVCEMVLVHGGRFPYGKEKQRVEIPPFLMDRHEVTVGRFKEFIKSEGMPPEEVMFWNQNGYRDDDQPVVGVNVGHARRFAQWAGKMLPTEVEWEYGAAWDAENRRLRRYPWGNRFEAVELAPTAFPPRVGLALRLGDVSPWGVCGLGSGVREWCEPAGRSGVPVIRGATQIRRGRRSFIKVQTHERLEAKVPMRSHDLGFRCIVYLNR